MSDKINVLAICGSTRKESSNLNLIKAIGNLAAETFNLNVFDGLADLPHFNPDLDHEQVPEVISNYRKQLRAADAILICTPEYAIGVPGTLKNAVDWTVSSMEFSKKPVALLTASTSGVKAHESLLGTLLIIEAKITADTQLVISSIKAKMDQNHEITDDHTLEKVQKMINALKEIVHDHDHSLPYLPAPFLV